MFLLCLKRKDSEVFKSSSCKKLLPSVHVTGTTCFDEYFFLHVITGTHNFHKSSSLLCGFLNLHFIAFLEASALKEVCILYVISTI